MDSPPASPAAAPANALPPGTRLGEFEVLGLLGVGGFGIVYRAFDHALEREVAIKEYMPAMLAGRTETLHVSLRSQSDAEIFEAGRRSFVNEAKLLARFDHPSLVKVYRFWESNDTAYMAMPVYRGLTLKAVRQRMQAPPDEAWLRSLLTPLLSALERLHGEGVYHRDIAPDNILIEADGRPVLLDFGAARRVIGDRSQNLTAILKPAFAPIEQYADASATRQGPWTDLYALGATLHFALVGHAPPPATSRMLFDDLEPLVQRAPPGCGAAFLQAIDWMLALRPGDRPQSVQALRAVLDGAAAAPAAPAPAPPSAWDATRVLPATGAAAPPATAIELPRAAPEATVIGPPAAAPPAMAVDPPPAARAAVAARWDGDRGSRRTLPLAVGAVAIAGAAAFWWWPRAPAPPTLATQAASAAVRPDAAAAASAAPAPVLRTPAAATSVPPVRLAMGSASGPAGARPAVPRLPAAQTVSAEPAASALARLPAEAVPARAEGPASAAAKAAAGVASAARPSAPAPSDDPSALCGKRVLVSQLICMERECRKPGLADHPACRKWYTQNPRSNP